MVMPGAVVGKKVTVLAEFPDGRVLNLTGALAELTVESLDPTVMGGPSMWTMEFRGLGPLEFEDHVPFVRRVKEERRRREWLCRFCGGVAEGIRCPHCNAVRTVLLE